MAGNVFEAVKQSVTVREAAEMYGIQVNRNGMACCPFHDDRHPSMKLNEEYFYCFGCGATGDVIGLTSRLYNLTPKEAAEKLAQDFGLAYDSQAPPRRQYVRQKSEAQKFKEDRDRSFCVLADYYHLLRKWETAYAPKTPEEHLHPRYMEAIHKKDYVGYLLDCFLEDNPEEQKLWIAEHQSKIAALERRVKIMAEKPTNRERLREITDGIEQGIKELFESEKYMRYLSVMSRFHRYSVNNTMLIYMQRPDATLVAGFNKWKNQFERHVKKGEHGITIIAPTPYKKKIEEMKRDPDTRAPILDADGKAVMEEKEIEIPMFRPVKVFDVSQTDGKPLPVLASSLSGSVPNYEVFMEALRRSAPVPIEFEPMAANMDGYFSAGRQRIALREGMSEVQTISAAIHEIAHSKLHDDTKAREDAARDGNQEPFPKKNRNTEEVEAESISYAVCQYFGIETGENSFGYIAHWSQGKELKELRASLETINKTAGELISDIDRHYKEICKERGIDQTVVLELAAQQAVDETVSSPEMAPPGMEHQEALLVLDHTIYLHIRSCDIGWDYTLYDKQTMKELDGGWLDAPDMSRFEVIDHLCEEMDIGNQSIQYAPLSMIETLQKAAGQQMGEQAGQPEQEEAADSAWLPKVREPLLDEYPMPDPMLTQDDLEKCGYLDNDLLPLSKERAYELMERDLTVYMIQDGTTPEMAFDIADLDAYDGIFAVSREEWEESPEFHEKILKRQEHQQEREQAFLSHAGDCFAIYQVSQADPQNVRFMNLDWLQSHGRSVDRKNYDLIYTAPLDGSGGAMEHLEKLYAQFNLQKPVDFHSPSMSISDIVAIKQGGAVSCHYCDSVGFIEIPGFLQDNPLKNVEMAVEDDYGMIDGVINNGRKEPASAPHREEWEKKKSVVEQLKSQPRTEQKKAAPKKSAERAI